MKLWQHISRRLKTQLSLVPTPSTSNSRTFKACFAQIQGAGHSIIWETNSWNVWHRPKNVLLGLLHKYSCILKWVYSCFSHQTYPEHLSADVSYPVLFQTVPLCLLHQVCHRAGSTVFHHQLDGHIQAHMYEPKTTVTIIRVNTS